ncbi:MAG TPA: hypothetical protein VME46_19800 [Acidimicrobiales bacterium]|nr:hypothetical protein [Acidimicrobiales bacterium]
MRLELDHPAWLAALVVLGGFVLVWRRWPGPFGVAQRRASLAVRAGLFGALVLALAGPSLLLPAGSQTLVVVADRSASTARAQAGEANEVGQLAVALPARDQMGVVSFGQDALVEDPPEHRLAFSGFATSPNANFTDIADALRLGASIVAPGARSHLLLVSDGRQNVGDAVGEAAALRAQGTRVDVLPLQVPLGPDVRVDSVEAPAAVPSGSRAEVTAVLVSNEDTEAQVLWALDDSRVLSATSVELKPGVTELHVLLPPATPGFHSVEVQIAPDRDSVPGNNEGEALFQVLGPQRVLVVAGQPGAARNVTAALRAAGIQSKTVRPQQVPATVAGIASWQAVALVNVSAGALGEARMAAIGEATRDLGVGLAAFGGPSTFGPGGLAGTPLEQALPISMKIPNPKQKTPVAVMLVLETVESSAGDLIVRSAARQLVENLPPQDLVGVTDGVSGIVVPLQPVGDGQRVQQEITDIPDFGDPPSYVPYMQDAATVLAKYPEATKFIIVMGDGDADYPLPSAGFIAGLVRQGITVSTVGADVHGSPLFMSYMAQIAAQGHGRFYDSESAYQLPSIFLDESQVQLQPWIVRERFHVVGGVPSPALDGVSPGQVPPLDGYVAATPKGTAQVVLSGPGGDPVLAQWQYGLGTATAWTSDVQGLWSSELLRSPVAGRLLAGIVAATLPLQASSALSLSSDNEGDETHLVARATGLPSDASAVVHVVSPDGSGSQLALAETSPGVFEGDVPTTEVGAYLMRAQVSANGRPLRAATAGIAIAYSPELRFMGTDAPFLAQVARAGGGTVLTSPDQVFDEPVPVVDVDHPLWFLLLVLAIALLPVDVALRRLDARRARLPLPEEAVTVVEAPEQTVPGKPGDGTRPPPGPPAGGEVPVKTRKPGRQEEPALAAKLLERLQK